MYIGTDFSEYVVPTALQSAFLFQECNITDKAESDIRE